ncbi:hypothetical protein J6590_072364 [Homalodisca vitripennis]|nr:hypothetical protein J6590_072364 [Homalodisca vitripennis]
MKREGEEGGRGRERERVNSEEASDQMKGLYDVRAYKGCHQQGDLKPTKGKTGIIVHCTLLSPYHEDSGIEERLGFRALQSIGTDFDKFMANFGSAKIFNVTTEGELKTQLTGKVRNPSGLVETSGQSPCPPAVIRSHRKGRLELSTLTSPIRIMGSTEEKKGRKAGSELYSQSAPILKNSTYLAGDQR